MFGYLRPVREELKLREYELYKSVYCGLCRQLGKDYGILSRMTLSYDCTVLAMLSISLKEDSPCVTKGRCVFNPVKKCMLCSSRESFHLAGAVSVIMAYYKLSDTISDSGFFKRMLARFLKLLLRRSFKKAKKAFPQIASLTEEMMKQQNAAEAGNASVDRAAEPTAKMISSLCRMLSGNDTGSERVLSVFGYYLGRWIYLIDAADDLRKDISERNYNPFSFCMKETYEATMLYCNDVLNMTVSQLILAYELLELSDCKSILDNVVYYGLSFQQKHCLFEKNKKCKEKHKDKNYYPFLSHGIAGSVTTEDKETYNKKEGEMTNE